MTPAASQFDQGTVCVAPQHGHVDDQTRRLAVVEQVVDLVSQAEEAVGVAGDSCLGQRQFIQPLRVGTLRVVPNDEPPVLDLLGDQAEQIIGEMVRVELEATLRCELERMITLRLSV